MKKNFFHWFFIITVFTYITVHAQVYTDTHPERFLYASKEQIKEYFGKPTKIEFSDGYEIWKYDKNLAKKLIYFSGKYVKIYHSTIVVEEYMIKDLLKALLQKTVEAGYNLDSYTDEYIKLTKGLTTSVIWVSQLNNGKYLVQFMVY